MVSIHYKIVKRTNIDTKVQIVLTAQPTLEWLKERRKFQFKIPVFRVLQVFNAERASCIARQSSSIQEEHYWMYCWVRSFWIQQLFHKGCLVKSARPLCFSCWGHSYCVAHTTQIRRDFHSSLDGLHILKSDSILNPWNHLKNLVKSRCPFTAF